MCHKTKPNKTLSPNNSNSLQYPRMLLSIQVNLVNSVVWTILVFPQISSSHIFFSMSLDIVQSASTFIGITVTGMSIFIKLSMKV